jgi:hypothetical protein
MPTITAALLLLLACCGLSAATAATSSPGVLSLDSNGLHAQVSRPTSVTLVAFCTRGTPKCKELNSALPSILKAVAAGSITVASVDCGANTELCTEYGVTGAGAAAVKLIPGPSAGGKVLTYKKDSLKAKDVSEWALASMPNHVQLLTSASEKATPRDKSKARVLLFTDKRETSALYKSIALSLRSTPALTQHVVVAEVRKAEKALFNRYEIGRQLPVLMVEPPLTAEGEERSPRRFDGKMEKELIRDFVLTFLPKDVVEEAAAAEAAATTANAGAASAGGASSSASASAAGTGSSGTALSVPELIDQSCLEKYCGNTLCLVMVLGKSSPDLARHQSQLALMSAAVQADKTARVRFAWVDAEAHAAWAASNFELQPSEFPQLLLLSVRKARFAHYVGSFEINAVREFVKDVAKSRVKTIPFASPEGKLLPLPEGQACPPDAPPPKEEKAAKKPATPTKAEPIKEEGEVHELTPALHESLLLSSARPWVILFHNSAAGGAAPTAATANESFEKVAKNLKNMIQFGRIDVGSSDPALQSIVQLYGVTAAEVAAAPVIKALAHSKKAKEEPSATLSYDTSTAGALEAKALRAWALELLAPAKVLSPITPQSMQTFMGDIAPNSPFPPKLMLFVKPAEDGSVAVPDMVKALSLEFGPQGVTFGVASSRETSVARQFQVKRIPSAYLMHQADLPAGAPGTEKDGPPPMSVSATYFDGPLTYPNLHAFVEQNVRTYLSQKRTWAERASKASGGTKGGGSAAGQPQPRRSAASAPSHSEEEEHVDLDKDEL